eukprot:207977-Heterocapsa_arctica.AAC.1
MSMPALLLALPPLSRARERARAAVPLGGRAQERVRARLTSNRRLAGSLTAMRMGVPRMPKI